MAVMGWLPERSRTRPVKVTSAPMSVRPASAGVRRRRSSSSATLKASGWTRTTIMARSNAGDGREQGDFIALGVGVGVFRIVLIDGDVDGTAVGEGGG